MGAECLPAASCPLIFYVDRNFPQLRVFRINGVGHAEAVETKVNVNNAEFSHDLFLQGNSLLHPISGPRKLGRIILVLSGLGLCLSFEQEESRKIQTGRRKKIE